VCVSPIGMCGCEKIVRPRGRGCVRSYGHVVFWSGGSR
jgi:hypothetical protein